MRNTCCGVLLLAGGKSSRLGQNKALLEYDGVPMIRRIAEQCVAFPEKILSSPIHPPVEGFWRIADDTPECGPL
ncbi:MAG: molybdenum cofactor guanylyltransferase, partial [Angelakisella sp.]